MTLFVFYGLTAILCGLAALFRSPCLPRYWGFLLAAALPQLALIMGIESLWPAIISGVCIAIWGLLNRTISGLSIVSIGVLLNIVAMVAHGGRMPIDQAVLARLGHNIEPGAILLGSKDIVVDGSLLLWLSDHLVIGTGKLALIASPGDVILLIGLLCWIIFSQDSRRNDAHAQPVCPPSSQTGTQAVSTRR